MNSAIASLNGLKVPVGNHKVSKLPIGFHMMSAPWDDHVLLRLGHALENALPRQPVAAIYDDLLK
jgi:Asp-tRNA(Asn)/Glu-tRNA(Gln) amidotransferase A subunit family amidase